MRSGLAAIAVSLFACNAITDTGKYQVVDCPAGSSCPGSSGGDGAAPPPPLPPGDSGGGGDGGMDAKPTCAANQGRIALTVAGTSGTVSEDRGMFSVSAPDSKVECVQPDNDQLRLRASGGTPTWSGVPCGTTGDCRFDFQAGDDLTVTATFP